MEIRRYTLDDYPQSYRLSVEAFGQQPGGMPPQPTSLPEGREVWLALDGPELVARVAAHTYASWWHGSSVATCGIASVAVAPERRGEGLLLPVFRAALAAAAERGEVLSTLFPTANGIYRPLGYELVASFDTVVIPTAELAGVRAPVATRTRRAAPADVPALKAVYDEWAAAQNGPLTRTGPRFAATDQELVDDVTAVSLAVDADDRVVGYAQWDRGAGYDPTTSSLEVHDLVATTADGYRALWRMLGTHTSVAGTVRLRTSGEDPARLVLPTATWDVVSRHPYMLRVDDPAAALTAAAPTVPGLEAEVGFAVAGDRLGTADGSYLLTVGADGTVCEATTATDGPTFTTQGLALKYAGAQSCANLRMTGHLTGPTTHDAVLDALLGSRPLHIRDYF
ncbi:enhanced intracellular survival protein Eis [Nocardioides sp.]|uniref:GNAT family N-acetyltransferase n=1 Tax=Nocardioides sp. TaxID=35761 RepID=UPI00271C1DE0|nr:GNAT family N-acetyltransferase [Nocardioides sp.]MDO9457545.1 GNAT family N-acetyltransferase [Nocardioides sp.]